LLPDFCGKYIGSVSLAIVTDLFVIHQRGRVKGIYTMAFMASQILGTLIGLYLLIIGMAFGFYYDCSFGRINFIGITATTYNENTS